MWEENLKRYDAIVAHCTRFDRKGKTMPHTSANGHMFSLLNKEGVLGIRFAKEKQQSYMEAFTTSYFKSYGAVMNGYIQIPDGLWLDTELLIRLLNESYDYVMSLPKK